MRHSGPAHLNIWHRSGCCFSLAVLEVKPLSLLEIGYRLPAGGLLSLYPLALSALLLLPESAELLFSEALLPRPFPLDLCP
jgi:hypothetical protein